MSESFVVNLQKLDEVSPFTKRIFPTDEMQKAVDKFKTDKISNGCAFGCFNGDSDTLNLADVTHVIEDLFIEDGYLKARVKFLASPMGIAASQLPKESIRYATTGTGIVDESGVVTEYNISYVSVIPK